MTSFDQNQDGIDEWLLVSIGYGDIIDRAKELFIDNPKRPIMTLDGGTSVFLYLPERGVLQKPESFSSLNEENVELLPHYLIFNRRK